MEQTRPETEGPNLPPLTQRSAGVHWASQSRGDALEFTGGSRWI